MCRDYRDMGHLDRYEAEGIDAEFQDAAPAEDVMAARMSAERELRKRDVREARRRGLPGALEGTASHSRLAWHLPLAATAPL